MNSKIKAKKAKARKKMAAKEREYEKMMRRDLAELHKKIREASQGTMKVVIVEPMKKPRVAEIEKGYKSLQKIVGGCFAASFPFDDPVALICNENGKLEDLPMNRALFEEKSGLCCDIVPGTFLLTGIGFGDFDSLSPELIEKYMDLFEVPQEFGMGPKSIDVFSAEEVRQKRIEDPDDPMVLSVDMLHGLIEECGYNPAYRYFLALAGLLPDD